MVVLQTSLVKLEQKNSTLENSLAKLEKEKQGLEYGLKVKVTAITELEEERHRLETENSRLEGLVNSFNNRPVSQQSDKTPYDIESGDSQHELDNGKKGQGTSLAIVTVWTFLR